MPRSDEAQAFFHAVYSAVQEIPPGKVTSYGHIAKLVGTRRPILLSPSPQSSHAMTDCSWGGLSAQRPRQVGVCLKHLPSDTSARFNHDNVPWQRVINAKGVISPRSVSTHPQACLTAGS
jgi:methylated-DNA-protein-cysteine methyltransferase-like protein